MIQLFISINKAFRNLLALLVIIILSINIIIAQCSINSITSTDACGGLCDGTIEINATGGSGIYKYSIDDGATFQGCNFFSDLCSGVYSIVIDDMTGCQDTSNFIINEFSFLSVSVTLFDDAMCNGSCDGALNSTPAGGLSPYTFLWNTTPVQIFSTATGLCAGTYTVTVTDMNDCPAQDSGTVSGPAFSIIIDSLISTYATSCSACDGTATVFVSGGMAPYMYMWSTGDTSKTITNLCADNYSVTITDNNGCSVFSTVAVNDAGAEVLNVSSTEASCNGGCDGTATVYFTCGDPPCSIIWRDGSGISIGQTDTTATGLCAGDYFVKVTNNSVCISFDKVIVEEPPPMIINVNGTNSCPGACNGSATVSVTNGTLPYTYTWSSGGNDSIESNLCNGIYFVTVTDSNGCSVADTVTINLWDTILFNTSHINSNCIACDGIAITCITGGTTPYTYSWSSGSTTYYEDSMCMGYYGITITDANGCISVDSITIEDISTISIDSENSTDITCNGFSDGTITITASGGTAPLEYSIDGGSTYQSSGSFTGLAADSYDVAVHDAVLCIKLGSTLTVNEPPPIFVNSWDTICDNDSIFLGGAYQNTPGTYYDTLPSVDGCDSVVATTLTVNLLPVITITPSPGVVCSYGDTVMLIASGAESYTWSPATGLNTTTGDTVLAFPSTDTTYTVTGTNIYGCIDSTTVSVQLSTVNPVASFSSSITSVCEGNTVTFNNTSTDATGFSWWFPGGTTADTTVQNPVVTYNTSGIFDVTLTALGCSVDSTITLSGYITVNPTYTTSLFDTICDGDSLLIGGVWQTTQGTYYDTLPTVDGCDSVFATTLIVNLNPTVVIIGDTVVCDSTILDEGVGMPGDTYLWSTNETTQSIVVYTTGIYWLMVTDVNGCQGSDTINVTINPTYIIPLSDTICDGDSLLLGGAYQTTDGTYYDTLPTVNGCDSILATTLTVNQTYNFSLSDNICDGDSSFIGGAWQTTSGIYYDTYAAINGCDSIFATTLTVNSIDTITTSMSICFGDSILLGGAYQTDTGIYYDTDTSSNGCDSVVVTTLTVNPLPPMPTVTVNGSQLASSPANAYQWYFYDTLIAGATSQFYTATQTGYYSVMVADVNGCWSISDPYWVTVTSINEIEFLSNLNIYPNPNTGEFIIEMNFSKSQDVEIKLFYISGQMIYSENLKQFKGAYFKRINIKELSTGVYQLQIKTGYGVVNKKVVVE